MSSEILRALLAVQGQGTKCTGSGFLVKIGGKGACWSWFWQWSQGGCGVHVAPWGRGSHLEKRALGLSGECRWSSSGEILLFVCLLGLSLFLFGLLIQGVAPRYFWLKERHCSWTRIEFLNFWPLMEEMKFSESFLSTLWTPRKRRSVRHLNTRKLGNQETFSNQKIINNLSRRKFFTLPWPQVTFLTLPLPVKRMAPRPNPRKRPTSVKHFY